MRQVVLSLGSNIGDRLAQLQTAVESLCASDGISGVAVSSVYETDPVGGPEQDDFLNAVLVVNTTLEPEQLLARAQQVETELRRTREVRWGPRTIDIDIIDFDGLQSDDPDLTLPHPRAMERAFVLIPWLEVCPGAKSPEGIEIRDLVEALPESDRVGVRLRADLSFTAPGA